jgi:hypothetical protein
MFISFWLNAILLTPLFYQTLSLDSQAPINFLLADRNLNTSVVVLDVSLPSISALPFVKGAGFVASRGLKNHSEAASGYGDILTPATLVTGPLIFVKSAKTRV